MHHRHTSRVAGAALAAVAATLSLTAFQPASGTAAGAAPAPKAPAATVAAAATAGSAEAAAPVRVSLVAHTTSLATPACAAKALKVSAYQSAVRPRGTGTGAAVVQFKNVSSAACVLRGHPTVAGAGNGSPQRSVPLKVTPKGTATTVRLAPGGKAWLKLTFVQVQGEADGYCVSGATPSVFPTMVIGLPGAGKHQVALDDGWLAECDNKVTATAVSKVKPA